MSGGSFEHKEYTMLMIIESIEDELEHSNYSDDTIAILEKAARDLRYDYDLVRAIDYLFAGDDGEETLQEKYLDIINDKYKMDDDDE